LTSVPELHADRSRAESFGSDADRYDRSRPSYPSAMVDVLMSAGPVDVLDVGCGTGIVSRLLQGRGCRVLGIDVDERMAEVARSRGTEVEVSPFESWPADGRTFDLVVSGQAWHWVDPVKGAAKAMSVLRPGGRVGVFWNVGGPPDDMKEAVRAVYAEHAPGLDTYSVLLGYVGPGRDEAVIDGLVQAGFADVDTHLYSWPHVYTTAEWLDVLPTHSDHAALPPDRLRAVLDGIGAAIDSLGGSFVMTYTTRLITGTR
jgi:SAM-dependent methyltransferase